MEDTMPTAPPVLPPDKEGSPEYRYGWLERSGPEGVMRLRANLAGVLVGAIAFAGLQFTTAQRKIDFPGVTFVLLLLSMFAGWLGSRMVLGISNGAGAVAKSFTLPSGDSTPYEQTFSFQEALAARGDVAGALESYEAVIAEQPDAVSARMRAAEHYARGNRNSTRAAELFKEIRRIPGVASRDALYASNRLVDLYDGPLNDPGRALVELRRIIEQYPGTQVATHARAALPVLKARLEALRTEES
ncbi:MAG: hypothetical protein JWM95_573 [Gemmatimonadetes bacterium]|nr:hypothetical protein [Gemmatimonadota bacterium]